MIQLQSRAKCLILYLLYLSGLLAFLIVGAELYFQIKDYRSHRHQFRESKVTSFQLSPFLQIEPALNSEDHINEHFFRGDPLDLSEKTLRIFTLGGSTTFSLRLPYKETYPKKLEDLLNESYLGHKIQIQNAACDWYSTQHSIIRFLFRIRHFKPDILIVMHGINDLLRSFEPEEYTRPGDRFQPDYSHYLGPLADRNRDDQPYFPFQTFLTPEKLRDFYSTFFTHGSAALSPGPHEAADEVKSVGQFKSLEIFEENLRILIRIAHSRSVKVILLTQPNIYRLDLNESERQTLYFSSWHMRDREGKFPDLASLTRGMRLFNDAVLRVAKETQTPVIDLDAMIPKNNTYFFDDVHPTAPAAEIEALEIHKELLRLEWIPKTTGEPASVR